jgi:hypothetical protein
MIDGCIGRPKVPPSIFLPVRLRRRGRGRGRKIGGARCVSVAVNHSHRWHKANGVKHRTVELELCECGCGLLTPMRGCIVPSSSSFDLDGLPRIKGRNVPDKHHAGASRVGVEGAVTGTGDLSSIRMKGHRVHGVTVALEGDQLAVAGDAAVSADRLRASSHHPRRHSEAVWRCVSK